MIKPAVLSVTFAVTVLAAGLIGVSASDFSDNASRSAVEVSKVDHNVATADSPALVVPTSQNNISDPTLALIEITLEPTVVDHNEAYLVNVHAMASNRSNDAPPLRQFVGSFSFFPPPVEGQARKFLVGVPKNSAGNDSPYKLMIELVPAGSDIRLRHSAVKVLDVTIIN